jgi:uncharacterized protein (TIGR02145 family)
VFDCAFAPPCTVTGCTATFTDPRDGKRYKTVVMPDGKTWFAQNLNYTKDLAFNAYPYEANKKSFTSIGNGIPAIGSYWCQAVHGSVVGNEADCRTYGALYTWETAMMVDGKYADETKTSSAWDESWVSDNYYSGAPGIEFKADINNARSGKNVKGGGRGICPLGWHIPTDREWAIMLDKVEGDGTGSTFSNQNNIGFVGIDVGRKLKSASTCSYPYVECDGAWYETAEYGLDIYGFCWLGASTSGPVRSEYMYRGMESWGLTSSTPSGSANYGIRMHMTAVGVSRQITQRYWAGSVRCLKN